MKISVSLPSADVAFLDAYAESHGFDRNRSAALHHVIDALRQQQLATQYAAAYDEWQDSGEAAVWATVAADGATAA